MSEQRLYEWNTPVLSIHFRLHTANMVRVSDRVPRLGRYWTRYLPPYWRALLWRWWTQGKVGNSFVETNFLHVQLTDSLIDLRGWEKKVHIFIHGEMRNVDLLLCFIIIYPSLD